MSLSDTLPIADDTSPKTGDVSPGPTIYRSTLYIGERCINNNEQYITRGFECTLHCCERVYDLTDATFSIQPRALDSTSVPKIANSTFISSLLTCPAPPRSGCVHRARARIHISERSHPGECMYECTKWHNLGLYLFKPTKEATTYRFSI